MFKLLAETVYSFLLDIFFYKKLVYKKPRTKYPQIIPNLRNFKNYLKKWYFDLRNWYNTKLDEYIVVFPDKLKEYFK